MTSHQLTSILGPQGTLKVVDDSLNLLRRHKLTVDHSSQDLHRVKVKSTLEIYDEPFT